jgi:DNA-binding transcriptional regulator YiaG
MNSSSINMKSIFISYSNKDWKYFHLLHGHLMDLERQGISVLWSDTEPNKSAKWHEEMKRALTSASVVVLLISSDYLMSSTATEQILPSLLAIRESKVVVPVLLGSITLEHTQFSQFQPVTPPIPDLKEMSQTEHEKLWAGVAEIIREALSSESIENSNQRKRYFLSSDFKPTHFRHNSQLKEERQRLHFTQSDVAKGVGVPTAIVERWENGTATPSSYIIRKLCRLLGRSAEELGFDSPDASYTNNLEHGDYHGREIWEMRECP